MIMVLHYHRLCAFSPDNHFSLVTSSSYSFFHGYCYVLPRYSIHWIRIDQYIFTSVMINKFCLKKDVKIEKCPKTESEKATKPIGRSLWLKLKLNSHWLPGTELLCACVTVLMFFIHEVNHTKDARTMIFFFFLDSDKAKTSHRWQQEYHWECPRTRGNKCSVSE